MPYSNLPVPGKSEESYLGLTLTTWVKIVLISAVMVWLFYVPCLRRLWQKTNPFYGEPNWGHSFFIPLVGLYYLYLNRDELLKAKVQPLLGLNFGKGRLVGGSIVALGSVAGYVIAGKILPGNYASYAEGAAAGVAMLGLLALLLDWGLGTLAWGLLVFGWGIYPGQNDWAKDFGMVATIFGTVLTLCGWKVMRVAWFPIVFLVCALPWPGLVYSAIAGPLQHLAAQVAVGVLNICGAESVQQGTKIIIRHPIPPDRILNVAEACAGLRSLMTFIFIAASMAFLSARPLWQRIVMTVSAVPIAVFCNVMRVSGQGLLDRFWSAELSQGFAHQFVGLVMLVPAMLMILGLAWVLDQIFIEEVEEKKTVPGKIIARPRTAPAAVAAMPGSLADAPRRPGLSSTTTEGH